MSKTYNLTPEQEVKKNEYIERFKKMAVDTTPTNKAKAEKHILDFYEHMKMDPPKIVWYPSPLKGVEMAAKAASKEAGLIVAENKNWTVADIEAINVSKTEIQEQAHKAFFGSFDSHYFCYYSFIANELPVPKDALIDISVKICEQIGIHWLFHGFAILTEKPTAVRTKNELLHAESGPALEYADGTVGYFLNGDYKQSLMDIILETKLGTET